jgi:short-subunit dehydrogenase
MRSSNHAYTLITGGSQGIGLALARECARRGRPVLIVALDEPELYQTAEDIHEAFGVPAHALGLDLTQPDAAGRVWDWCEQNGYEIDCLINNAGFGRSGLFEQLPLEEYRRMLALNNWALFEMTYRFIPMLLGRPGARIMNMSSLEAYLPTPYKAAYSGVKHFVFAFSLALAEEMRPRGISVTVLCPGSTLTNEDGLRRIKAMGRKARLVVMMPDQVAREAIDGMLRGKRVVIPGRINRFIAFLARNIPLGVKMRLLAGIFTAYADTKRPVQREE